MIDEKRMREVQSVIAVRGEAAFGTVVDGMSHLLAKARRGDPSARVALRQLRDGLREIDQLLSVSLPGEN